MFQPQNGMYNPQFNMPAYPGYQPQFTPNQQNQLPFSTNPFPPSQQQITSTNTVTPVQQAGLQGRVVGTVSEVRPNDVPSDGSPSFFPLNDYSEIYVKSLNNEGLISTVVYKPVQEKEGKQPKDIAPPAYISELSAKVDEIFDYLPKVTEELENLKKAVI